MKINMKKKTVMLVNVNAIPLVNIEDDRIILFLKLNGKMKKSGDLFQ